MTAAMKVTLLAIVIVIGGMVASFIWFVATWDKDAEDPISHLRISQEILA